MRRSYGLGSIRWVAACRGILYVLTRFGGTTLRRLSFNQHYGSGQWDYFDTTHSGRVVQVVEKYAHGGCILDMGCGTGTLASLLDPKSFERYVGVDASSEAIRRASRVCNEKISFEVSDIQSYRCRGDFDVIVFEESLYYVPFFRGHVLRRYARSLRPGGSFVVTVAHPHRFRAIIRVIRANFQVVEERRLSAEADRILIVFHC